MSHLAAPCTTYLTSPVHCVETGQDINEAYAIMVGSDIGCVAALREGKLVGLVSRTDLLRIGSRQAGSNPRASLVTLPKHPVEEFMTKDVVTVTQGDSLHRAAQLMVEHRIHRVFVVNDAHEPLGVISTRDLMMAVRDQRMNTPVEELMSTPVFTIRAEEHVSEAVARLEKAHITGLAVVDRGWPVGVFTQRDALLFKDMARSAPVEEAMDPAVLIVPANTLLHRAAAQACAMKARRILVVEGNEMVGVITGLTFARAVAQ